MGHGAAVRQARKAIPVAVSDAEDAEGPLFADRAAAGRQLAERLADRRGERPVLLALPRGGVPVACEVGRALDVPVHVLLVRKIGAPGAPEYGIGAVAEGTPPLVLTDAAALRAVHPPAGYLEQETAQQCAEIARRRALYGEAGRPPPLAGRSVIVIDDGIATGGTMRVALQAAAAQHPARLTAAAPVAAAAAAAALGELAEVVCVAAPAVFEAVGRFYRDFAQVPDAEVLRLLG